MKGRAFVGLTEKVARGRLTCALDVHGKDDMTIAVGGADELAAGLTSYTVVHYLSTATEFDTAAK